MFRESRVSVRRELATILTKNEILKRPQEEMQLLIMVMQV